jgi:hypothetical protein
MTPMESHAAALAIIEAEERDAASRADSINVPFAEVP